VFGAFTAVEFSSDLENILKNDPTSFIFRLRKNGSLESEKIMIKKNASIIFTKRRDLLVLGDGYTHDLLIENNSNKYTIRYKTNRTNARSNLCYFFECPEEFYHGGCSNRFKPNGTCGQTFLAGEHSFLTTEIETFQINI
jgi:hypothetical protein